MVPRLFCTEAAALLALLGAVFISLTAAIPQFEDLRTISIRATKISASSELNAGEFSLGDDIDNSNQQVHGLYPDLKFTCNTTLKRVWYIGMFSFASSATEQQVNGPAFHFWTSNKVGRYISVNSTPILMQNPITNVNPMILMNELVRPIEVHINDVISIVQAQSTLTNRVSLLFNVRGPTGQFGTSTVREQRLVFQSSRNSSRYPMLAVETDSPGCTFGFLNLNILESFLVQVFTPSADEHRLIPSLNFTCSGSVSRWIVGGVMIGSITDENLFKISLWQDSSTAHGNLGASEGQLQPLQEVVVGDISLTDKPNVYIATTKGALEFQAGTFIGISRSNTSSFSLFYVNGGQHVNLIYSTADISSGSNLQSGSANRQQNALPLLRPLQLENINLRSNCAPEFITNGTLANRALLIANITYAPEPQQQQTEDESTNQGVTTTVNTTRTDPSTNDKIKRDTLTETSLLGIGGSVYVFCGNPFTDDGRILSWTFAARPQQTILESRNSADIYPQLLILRPQTSSTSPQLCTATTFNKTCMTTIISPPILLETLDMYRVNVSLSYNRGDVLGVFQPPENVAVLSLAFINNEMKNMTTAVRLQSRLVSSQLTIDASVATTVFRALPLMTISTTNDAIKPDDEKNVDMTTDRGEDGDLTSTQSESTNPNVNFPGIPAVGNNLVTTGIAVGVAIAVLLMFIVVLVLIVYLARRTWKKKHDVSESANVIPLSSIETNIYINGTDTEENVVDPLGNPTYAEAGGSGFNQLQVGNAVEYEVPVTSPTHLPQPSQMAVNLYQDVSQPYETPVDLIRKRVDAAKPNNDNNVYHVLEAPVPKNEENNYEVEIYVPAGNHRQALTSVADDQYVYATLTETQLSSVRSNGSYFEQSDEFWKPSSDQEQLYRQLSIKKYREIARHRITVTDKIGSGQFGAGKGVWTKPNKESIEVAVKKLKPNATESDRVKFLQEAAIMGQFRHPNIITLMGVVTIGDPVMIVLEYMVNGDLRRYLTKQKPKMFEKVSTDWPHILLNFCQHIAAGMDYLHKKGFIHRDLAARNILVAANSTCKISDFGLSRDLEEENYYVSKGGMIPVKWTAPEALNFKKFSPPCDVWSYGIVMYEIWSFGNKPYKKIKNLDVLPKVEGGYRMPPPPGCPREVYRIMIQCWHPEASLRPSFSEVLDALLQPQSELLQWRSQDRAVHPEAAMLAAALDAGEMLYSDLQSTYMSTYEAANTYPK